MNDTNSAAIPYLEEALKINDALLGLPAIPLVVIGCLMCGYFLKVIPFYRNRWIPFGVFCFGVGALLFITPLTDKVIVGRSVIYGLAAAWVATVIHRKFLSRYDDAFTLGDTDRTEKPKANP